MSHPPGSNERVAVLFAASLASFLVPFMSSAINIALPTVGKQFALDAVTLNWVATIYILAAAMFLVPFGRIADIYGRRKIFTWGVIVYTAASFLAALSNSAALLLASRVLQGIGGAMFLGTAVAMLTSVYPPGERGRVLGINVAVVYCGLSLGPPLGGFLTHYFGWPSIFLINVPLGLIAIAVIFWKIKSEWAEARGEKFDVPGSVTFSLSLVGLMYGFSLLPDIAGGVLIALSIIALVLLLKWEARAKSPVLNLALFRNNIAFTFSNLAALINYSATAGVGFLVSLYLQYITGLSPERAGLVLVSQPVIMAALSPVAGRLSDKIEPRVMATLGMSLTTIGLAILAFLNQNSGLGLVFAGLMVLGLGFALFSSPNVNAVMSSVTDKKFYGVASGILSTMRLIGQMLSLGIVLLIFALFIGRVQITPAQYPLFLTSFRTAFIIFAVLCFIGVFASYARGKTRS